jgi:putative NADH-flavin reductase
MKLLVFGASGAMGRLLVAAALAKGHAVTGFVRNPKKLAIAHRSLTIVAGDVAEKGSVEHIVAGHGAVISCLGVGVPLQSDPAVIAGIGHIVTAMQESGPARLIYLSFLGVADTRAQLGPLLGGLIAPLVLRHEVADHEAKEALVARSNLDWTIVRPPKFSNGKAKGDYRHGKGLRTASLFPTVPRADVAAFMLSQLEDTTYVRRVVEILR